MKTFTDLQAWQTGIELVKEIYRITKLLPPEERFGMTSQLRRASLSVVANIAEGFNRVSPADKSHKYLISRGECSEVFAFLLVCTELGLLSKKDAEVAKQLSQKEGKLLSGLVRAHKPNP